MPPHVPQDPRWPEVLSLAVHELRTPMTVVAGYIRMLLREAGGALSDPQRHMLEEAEKSCGRLSALLVEMSDLARLESGAASWNGGTVDMRAVLAEAIAQLAPLPDRAVAVELDGPAGSSMLTGDPVRLRSAFSAILAALRRELVSSSRLLVRETVRGSRDGALSWIAIGSSDQIGPLSDADERSLVTFDEWRGGCGLSLGVARRVIERHGGRVWSPPNGAKAGAIIAFGQP